MKRLFLLFFSALLCTAVSAHDFEVDGIYYDITSSSELTVGVTYQGSSYNSAVYSGSIVIPEKVTYNSKEYSVTSIVSSAFRGCSGLTSITIPNSVTSIGDWAFSECRGMISITIPKSVTSIGIYAFYFVILSNSSLQEVHISDLSSWCKIHFANFASNPTYYSHKLYLDGKEIVNLTIPNDIETISNNTFLRCSGLESVTIPNSVTSIGESAFSGCSGMTSVTIPNSVTSIGSSAFSGCSGLTNVDIPNSVTSIGEYAFSGCSGLKKITIPDSITSIESATFQGCSSLISVDIPNTVTSIGNLSFKDCSSLASVNIPNTVTSIGEHAFYSCKSLADITLPNSITYLGNSTFSYCRGLTSFTIPNSVKSIGPSVFEGCSGLKIINIPNSVKNIGMRAFYKCESLSSVNIPDSVTNINEETFRDCSNLENIKFSKSLTLIGVHAFTDCNKIKKIHFPESCKTISKNAFFRCISLKEIILPSTCTVCHDYSFLNCKALERIVCNAITPPTIYASTFSSNIYTQARVYVPIESLETYKKTLYWKDFTTIRHSGYIEVKSITFDNSTYELEEGDTMKFAVTVSPEDATDKTISWKSSNETIATVNDGVVTAIKPGTATITATSICTPAVTATCKIVVTKKYVSVTGIALDKTKAEMAEGETLKLTATISPDDATDKTITWTSSNESVATVKNGTVTAVKEGKAIITAKAGEMTATCEITVIHTDQCAAPVITYADGKLLCTCETEGAKFKYMLTDTDIKTEYTDMNNGSVNLSACYTIKAYAYADGYTNSEQVTATLYWINGSDVSTNINQTEMRGVMATCSGGIITVSGLTDGETVMFYDANGAQLYTGTAQNGTVSYAPSTSGVIIVKIGTTSIKVVK